MALALFDLDNTLLNGDSDHAWGEFLCELGVLDASEHLDKQAFFYQQYLSGTLNIDAFLNYQLKALSDYPIAQLDEWHQQFMRPEDRAND